MRPCVLACRAFGHPAHRINLLPDMPAGLVVVDDSRGTNPHAVRAALAVVRRVYAGYRIVWIGGGQSDQAPKSELVHELTHAVDAAVLFGQSRHEFAELLRGALPVQVTASIAEAAQVAIRLADDGPSVLLFSPAAKSFDMFDNYAHRAEAFRVAIDDALSARAKPGRPICCAARPRS